MHVEALEQSLAQSKHSASRASVIVTLVVEFTHLLAVAHSRPGEPLSGCWPQSFLMVLMSNRAPIGQQMDSSHQGCNKVPWMEIPWSSGDTARPKTIPGAENQLFIQNNNTTTIKYRKVSSRRSHVKETFFKKRIWLKIRWRNTQEDSFTQGQIWHEPILVLNWRTEL